jgi:hypothetical protein
VSIFDHVTPSERIADLELNVRRIRKETGLDVVPILIVEGGTDEGTFEGLSLLGNRQVFAAGTRGLVEQMLMGLRGRGAADFNCVYLVDCDGIGKTGHLKEETDLIVTETCDLEADLVHLGVARRVVEPYCSDPASAISLVDRACRFAMPLSIVRRAANTVYVSMKRDGQQIRLGHIDSLLLNAWDTDPPSPESVSETVAELLGWSAKDLGRVQAELNEISRDFSETCMGKDVLDALHRLAMSDCEGDIRGWSVSYFHNQVIRALSNEDLPAWEVGRRLRAWEATTDQKIIPA